MGTKFVGNFLKTQSIQCKVFVSHKFSMAKMNVFFKLLLLEYVHFHWNAKDTIQCTSQEF
jgi:hypothetical protein